MTAPILRICGLQVSFPGTPARRTVLQDVDMQIRRGEILGVAGESGSGKSTAAFAILRYLEPGRIDRGSIEMEDCAITSLAGEDLRKLRATRLALVPQDPLASLNPAMCIADQLVEQQLHIQHLSRAQAMQAANDMLRKVRLQQPERILESYPHQVSGGQQQRVLIAMALLAQPDLLLLDEPTTGLDASVQADIVDIVRNLVRERDLACLFISHDLELLMSLCGRIAIMRNGKIVETATPERLRTAPAHEYTRMLLASRPGPDHDRLTNPLIEPATAGIAMPAKRTESESATAPRSPALRVTGLSKCFAPRRNMFGTTREKSSTTAATDISFDLHAGETLAIIGESGSGKSTLAKMIMGLERPDTGQIELFGTDIAGQSLTHRSQAARQAIQMIFQNPASTLNPSHTIFYQLSRALACVPQELKAQARFSTVADLLEAVRIEPDIAERKPDQLSGGQKQRVAIARALAANPAILVADEPVSALDVTIQAAIIELLIDIQRSLGLALIFISHDLPLVRYIADRVAVLHRGRIVESGETERVFAAPQDDYTRHLLQAGQIRGTMR